MKIQKYKAHPWHGVSWGEKDLINAYIEIVPTDTVKYEIDKETGHLLVDRPQRYSSQCPMLYGFVPQTYCGDLNAAYCMKKTGRTGIQGDGDPLDICVLTERPITHGDILVRAIPIGGLRMIDGGESDDKIIAVLQKDILYGKWKDIAECPDTIIQRLRHYFLTYKEIPGDEAIQIAEVVDVYGAEEAWEVINTCIEDYQVLFGSLKDVV